MMLAHLLRSYIAICEAYSASVWRRWWGNSETGELLPVAHHEDHDQYLFEHLDEFFSSSELAYLPDPDDFSSYDDISDDDDIRNNRDAILVAAYDKGWHAILYDGNNKHLSLRTGTQPNLRGLRKIVSKIASELPIEMFILEIESKEYTLDPDQIGRFIKFGRLPS